MVAGLWGAGMGCEGCQAQVQQLLEGSSGVVGSDVDFVSGTAKVLVNSQWGFNLTTVAERCVPVSCIPRSMKSNESYSSTCHVSVIWNIFTS